MPSVTPAHSSRRNFALLLPHLDPEWLLDQPSWQCPAWGPLPGLRLLHCAHTECLPEGPSLPLPPSSSIWALPSELRRPPLTAPALGMWQPGIRLPADAQEKPHRCSHNSPFLLPVCVCVCVCVCARVCVCVCTHICAQSCLTVCDAVDCSSPGSFVHGDSPRKNTGMGCHFLLQLKS